MVKRVLLLVTNHGKMGNLDRKTGWYLPEVAHPYKVFKEAGYDVIVASPKGGEAPMDPSSFEAFEKDPECQKFMKDFQITTKDSNLKDTVPLNKVDNIESVDVFFCAGGHGPMFDLPLCELVNEKIAAVYEKGGIAAAVCHGPAGIVNTKLSTGEYLVNGKQVTCFTDHEEAAMKLTDQIPFLLETELKNHGAIFVSRRDWECNVVEDQRVVTGQNPASASPMSQKIVQMLSSCK